MSDDYTGHMLELILDEIKAVHELGSGVQEKVADLPTRAEFDELKQDVRVIKAAVMDLSRDLAEHKSLPTHVAHGRA